MHRSWDLNYSVRVNIRGFQPLDKTLITFGRKMKAQDQGEQMQRSTQRTKTAETLWLNDIIVSSGWLESRGPLSLNLT